MPDQYRLRCRAISPRGYAHKLTLSVETSDGANRAWALAISYLSSTFSGWRLDSAVLEQHRPIYLKGWRLPWAWRWHYIARWDQTVTDSFVPLT